MNKCAVVKDLLPLYADGVCSEESKKFVSEHLHECDDCCEELESLRFDFKITSADEKQAVKKFRKKTEKKVAIKIISVILALAMGVFGAVNAVWYLRYSKPFDKLASMQNKYMSEANENTSEIEAILGENNSYGIDTKKYENLYIGMQLPEYLENNGLIKIVDGKNATQEIRTDIEVRIDSKGDYTFLVNLMYDPPVDEDFYWPCFRIDEDMKLILTDVEEYVNKQYKHYMNNRTEEEAKAIVRENIEKDNAQDRELYDEYYGTVRDLMIVLHEGFGIGNVTE